MATALRFEALGSLRRIDPDAAALGAAAAALIAARGLDAEILHTIAPGAWFGCTDHVCFQLRDSGPLDDARIGDAVRMLDRGEPLLERLEHGLGLDLEPSEIREGLGDAVILLVRGEGLAAEIALPVDHPAAARWRAEADALTPAPGAMPVLVHLLADGPRLPMAEAGALEAGDLVLLSARTTAILASEAGRVAGLLDFLSGDFTLQTQGTTMADEGTGPARDFAVPLTIRLPDRMTSAASLADLRPGTALPLGPLTDGMPVELLVAGRTLARGELVQLGDRFAVLIEERSGIDDSAAAPVEAAGQDPAAGESEVRA
ncbi:FliM/FliN family flagellar motor switch protein [Sphingosinicella sp. BN140058]|uniref:FliM/FliN family flagellar motor switch protein n=1 Tax=Sphingosinicella sp. BN140058 TaxID=1892855 RepID=UPI001012DBD1|nr:FliM/FliN family flagellar motor switch protein [Sphingosinicella sp. BN140058]QAY75578.1 hypothetical protein ETR14_02820 [Sphingosinicella sp. BN140058]